MPGLLFGPIDDPTFVDRFLKAPVDSGRWATFSAGCQSWESAIEGLERPDVLLLWPGYQSVPAWVWSAPVPVVALAHDANLLWHGFRHLLPLADLVLTDGPSAERLRRAGVHHARAANLFGLDRHFVSELEAPETERDIDVLFVGNLNPAVQSARLPWLGRLGALAEKYRVLITGAVFGAEYRALLRRAKLVFNHGIRGECNLRSFEAAASGAVLLQDAGNAEVRDYLEPDSEFARYTEDDFETVVIRLLTDEAERRGIASRAKARVRSYSFDFLIEQAIDVGGPDWDAVRERTAKRAAASSKLSLAGRVWMRASLNGPDADPTLLDDLRAAGNTHGLALFTRAPGEAEPLLAAVTGNRVSAVGRAAALADLDRLSEAVELLRTTLADLDRFPELTPLERETCPYPSRFDHLRVGWERAAFDDPDDSVAESASKRALLQCRAASLLAVRTGDLAAYQVAARACPEIPAARAALGCALARAGRFTEAVPHLRFAVEQNPFDHAAALALEAALADAGDLAGMAAVRSKRRILARAAPGLVPDPGPSPIRQQDLPAQTSPAGQRRTRFVELPQAEFAARCGSLDTAQALSGFTPAHDTRAVLTLLAHVAPRRVLEIGTAAGHMTANLTAFTPADAVVYSLGVVAEDGAKSGTVAQDYEVPRRHQFAQFVNHFGTAHKAMLVTADSRNYDFTRLAPLDFAFVDGGHDLDTVKSDSLGAYQALRPGGCLVWHDLPSKTAWVEVERAVAEIGFPEPVYCVAGTEVAFLMKGEGVAAAAGPETAKVVVAWDGEFAVVHSLAAVNRAVCSELIARSHEVSVIEDRSRPSGASPCALSPELAARLGCELPGAVTVRHRWPPDFTLPAGTGPFVLIQPWEFGRLPRAWVEPIHQNVDEVWAYSRSVLRTYVASGIPEDRIVMVPPGVDSDRFRPGLEPLKLPTAKSVRLLFVGGTLPRKGFDVLLAAYRRAFTARDDVAVVVKDMGVGTFYRGQTAGSAIERFRADPSSPEIVYLANDLSEADLARLYAACDVLLHPYRGEGFGLPVLESMACGKPVVVTAGGPTDEFVPNSAGWRIPAKLSYFPEEAVGDLATAGRPWWLEPDVGALAEILRAVVADADEREQRGQAARRAALGWTWARTASSIEDRIRVLRTRTPVRLRRSTGIISPASRAVPARHAGPPGESGSFTVTSDVPLIVSAIPRSRPRVSLTMIVKNEEKHLPECLASVRDLVDEAVVVDTGSSDQTRAIAKSFGAVVGEFPWVDHFAAARNAALDHATADYAFWMDADDRIDEENRQKLRALFGGLTGGNDAYVMKCLCVPDKPGAGGTVVDHVRLFRHTAAHRWTYRVHEQILPALRATGADVRWSGVTVRHVGYVDATVRRRKLDRDLRLLKLDEQDRPNDPFTLFNLGSVFNELGDHQSAAEALQKSLAGSHPRDSIVRKLYAMLTQCHARTGDRVRAVATCTEGRGHYPDDAELLFLAAGLARENKDYRAAELLYRQLIDGRESDHFASIDAGLRVVKGRHNLAVLLLDTNRPNEAEGLWRAALTVDPQFLPAHAGLGDLYLRTHNETGVGRQVAALRELGSDGAAEAVVLEARQLGVMGDHAAAGRLLEDAVLQFPNSVGVRAALSHVRLADGSPPEVLEAAFKSVLELDPTNAQALHNLEVLYRNTGRWVEGVIDPPSQGG